MIQYTAMIASYGKSGALYEAFNCVDEMILNGIKPNIDIFNNLLCGCISQPALGFKYALTVWQMCLKFKVKPNIDTYNLLLKAARDCNSFQHSSEIQIESPKMENKNKFFSQEKNLFPVNSEEHSIFLEMDQDEKKFSPNSLENMSTNIDTVVGNLENKIQEEVSSNNDVVQIKQQDVHIIEEMQVVGKALGKQIENLEWWQEIKPNIDSTELMRDLSE